MEITIKERMTLAGILRGQEGRVVIIKALRKAREALELDEQDHVDAEIYQEFGCSKCHYLDYFAVAGGEPSCPLCHTVMVVGSNIRWNPKASPRDISLGEVASSVIAGHFKGLEEQGKLTDDLLDLYEKFIPD